MSFFQSLRPVPVACLVLLAATVPRAEAAPPALTSSETSFSRECLGGQKSPESLAAICRAALDEEGVSVADRARLKTRLGGALDDLGRRAEARELLSEAARVPSVEGLARSYLGWSYWATEEFDRAGQEFEAAVALTGSSSALAGLGSTIWRSGGDIARARELLQAALAVSPNYQWCLRELGWLEADTHGYEAARAAFLRAIANWPEDANANYGLAVALAGLGRYAEAVEPASVAVREAPDEDDYLGYRAFIARANGNYGQAIADAGRVLDRSPANTYAAVQKARAEMALGRSADAVRTLGAAEEAGADSTWFHFQAADILSDADELEAARAHIERYFAAVQTPDAEDYALRAFILLRLGKPHAALEVAQTGVAVHPRDPVVHYYVALGTYSAGLPELALKSFGKAVALGLEEDDVSEFMRFLMRNGDVALAIRARGVAAMKRPQDPPAGGDAGADAD